jgi:phytoene/squalene synthetase
MLDDYTRAQVNRAIEDALRPRGMSTHSGKASIDAATLQRLVTMIDRSAEGQRDAQERIAELGRDAARWRCLRAMTWDVGPFAVVRDPKQSLKLGAYCPSRENLDAAIDAAISAMRKEGE